MNIANNWKDKKFIFYPVLDCQSLVGAKVYTEDGEIVSELKTVIYRHEAGKLPELRIEFYDDPPVVDPVSEKLENPFARTYEIVTTNFEIRMS